MPGMAAADALFRPHGQFTASMNGAILEIAATGPFNVELIAACMQSTHALVERTSPRETSVGVVYGVLAIFRGSMLMPPEALAALARAVLLSRQSGSGSAAVAIVADSTVEGRGVMMRCLAAQVFAPVDTPLQGFGCRDSAEVWLRQRLVTGG